MKRKEKEKSVTDCGEGQQNIYDYMMRIDGGEIMTITDRADTPSECGDESVGTAGGE